MTLPNFFVIGAAECGTTSICNLLGRHPDVFMADSMEIHYFGRDDPEKTRSRYESHFDEVDGESAVGEGSTSYRHPHIIEACASEISFAVPDARLITHGIYWRNLGVYRRHFRDEQILVVFLEDFSRSPQRELRRCFSHIDVDTHVTLQDADRPRNQSRGFRRDRVLAQWLRRGGIVSWARELLPDRLFSAGKKLLTEPDRYSAQWDAETKRRVASEFEEDARRFLEYCGKSPGFWSLSGG